MDERKIVKYFEFAKSLANIFSKDSSSKVGALFIAKDSMQILSTGYNGMPRGFDENVSTRWERPNKYLYVEHAERNGIYNACRNGVSLNNSICIITMFPCADCMRGLIQSGVTHIITVEPDGERWMEHAKIALEMANECSIDITYVHNA